MVHSRHEPLCACPDYELVGDDWRCKCRCNYKTSDYFKFIWGIALLSLKIFLLLFVVVFVVFPLVFRYSYKLQRQVVFLNSMNIPFMSDYDHPDKYGLPGTRNFYIKTDEGISLGVWHILPKSLVFEENYTALEDYEKLLNDGQNVVIYNHGNAGNRLTSHRIELYKLLREFFHVIAYDYRSYGDSSNIDPSEEGVVRDATNVFKWVWNRTRSNIFVWGHSLGSSVSLNSLSRLEKEGYKAKGVILEGAFNNFNDEIGEFPLAKIFSYLPWFHFTVLEPMIANKFVFASDEYISEVDAPILMLHAEDDNVVPYRLGHKLYKSALKSRTPSQGNVILKKFDKQGHYGHKNLYKAPELRSIVANFIAESTNENKKNRII